MKTGFFLFLRIFVILVICNNYATGSGAYDNGSSVGQGKLELDLTWNPFNYFDHGQNYVVAGYGITNRIDLHGYFCDHGKYKDGVNSYYFGLFYQFLDTKYLDLATAIGKRKMMDLNYSHIFFPQLLYNVKLAKGFTIGGSIVNVRKLDKFIFTKSNNNWLAFDTGLFIPFKKFIKESSSIEDLKLGIGLFKTGIKNNKSSRFLPTYSIDIKFKRFYKPK